MANLNIVIRAIDRSGGGFNNLTKGLDGLGKSAAAAGAAVAAIAAKLAVDAVQAAVKLEKSLAEVQTLLPQLTDQEFGALAERVREVGTEFGVMSDDLIPAMYQAISAGIPADNVVSFLETASKNAVGGVTSLETSVDALTTVTNTWGRSAGVTAAQASDVLFTAVKLGKTTMDELGGSLGRTAGIASQLGGSFEETVAGLVVLTQNGISTSEAMTQMRALIQQLAAPTEEAAKQFGDLGIEVNKSRLEQEGLLPVIQDILDATEDNEALQRKLFSSVEALNAAYAIASGEGANFTDVLGQLENASGAADEAFNTMADTTAHQLAIAQAEMNTLMEDFGTQVLPLVNELLKLGIELFDALAPAIETAIETLSDFIGIHVAILDAVGWVWNKVFGEDIPDAIETTEVEVAKIADHVRQNFGEVEGAVTKVADHVRQGFVREIPEYLRTSHRSIESFNQGVAMMSAQWALHLTVMSRNTQEFANNQRQALESHLAGLARARRHALGQELIARAHHNERQAQLDADWLGELQAAANKGIRIGQSLADEWARSAETGKQRVLSESERLAAGLLVSMTNACGTVTGFKQCVDGAVVQFDADMNRIKSSAELMQEGIAQVSRDACGALRSVTACVDGQESVFKEFDRMSAFNVTTDGRLVDTRGVSLPDASAGEQARRAAYQRARDEGKSLFEALQIAESAVPMARGGIVRSPTLALIGESGPEAVLPLSQAGGGDRPLTVVLELDGSRLGEAVISNVNRAAREGTLLLSGSYDA